MNSILTPVDTGVVIASSPVNGGVGGVQKKGFSPFKEVLRPTHTPLYSPDLFCPRSNILIFD